MIERSLPDDDCETMLRLQRGDDLALNDLIDRWQQPLLAFIIRYVGNEADAVDLAQELFVHVYESRARYKPKTKLSSWLFTIARNLCHNHTRWKLRHPTIPLDGSEAQAHDGADCPSQRLISAELADEVRAAVLSLPEELKTVVLLFEYQEMSYRKIAAIEGCSEKAVETRLYRARQLLRVRMGRVETAVEKQLYTPQ